MATKKAVVFDLYDTLLYNRINNRPYYRLFAELGMQGNEGLSGAYRIALTENFDSLSALVERIKPGANIDLRGYEEEIETEIASASLYPETRNVLGELKARNVRLGLISNLATPYKRPFFELGLDAYFDKIVFSCDIGFRKPECEIYGRMLADISMEPQFVLMTGNNARDDVNGPRSVGMESVHLDRKNGSLGSIRTLEGTFLYI